MNKQELEALGLTPDDVSSRLVDRLFEHYIAEDTEYSNDFQSRMERAVKTKVDERLEAAMTAHVLPKIAALVEGICLQETNKWGEAKGTSLTFTEYLTQRVDNYIREEVNHNGKTKEQDSYSWCKSSTRIAYMIHEHLQYNISQAIVTALGEVNSSVRKGLEEAVKIALANVQVRVNTEVKRT